MRRNYISIALMVWLLALWPGRLSALALILPSDEAILAELRTRLAGQDEAVHREIKRKGNRTIEMVNCIATEMDPRLAPAILADTRHYADWALNGINQRPTGGTYVALLHGLNVDPKTPDLLTVTFSFDLPLFRTPRSAAFQMESSTEKGIFTLTAEALDTSGTFTHADIALKVFPAPRPGFSWLYARGEAQLRSWVLYEALPEKLLNRESGERIRIILDNYLREENSRRAQTKQ